MVATGWRLLGIVAEDMGKKEGQQRSLELRVFSNLADLASSSHVGV